MMTAVGRVKTRRTFLSIPAVERLKSQAITEKAKYIEQGL